PPERAAASSEDVIGGRKTVVRRVYLTDQMAKFGEWEHLRTVLRVESETFDARGRRTAHDHRYFIASLPVSRLTAKQWLRVVREHWGVENNCHHTLDTTFEENDRPWIEGDPRGMVIVALLRRLAYNLLTLFRSVTQRSTERRATPWLDILRWFYNAMISATDADLHELRHRPLARAPARPLRSLTDPPRRERSPHRAQARWQGCAARCADVVAYSSRATCEPVPIRVQPRGACPNAAL